MSSMYTHIHNLVISCKLIIPHSHIDVLMMGTHIGVGLILAFAQDSQGPADTEATLPVPWLM